MIPGRSIRYVIGSLCWILLCVPTQARFLQTDPIGTKDDLNLYTYTRGDPIDLGDRSGAAPNQAGVTNASDIAAELSANGNLYALSNNHADITNRYFFTDSYGWVDIRHFAYAAALVADGTPSWLVLTGGFGNEVYQWATEWGDSYRSGFSYEDLPSNSAGAEFGRLLASSPHVAPDIAFKVWALGNGARHYMDPRAGFAQLPATDPAYPNGPDGKGTSNFVQGAGVSAPGQKAKSGSTTNKSSSQSSAGCPERETPGMSCGTSVEIHE